MSLSERLREHGKTHSDSRDLLDEAASRIDFLKDLIFFPLIERHDDDPADPQ